MEKAVRICLIIQQDCKVQRKLQLHNIKFYCSHHYHFAVYHVTSFSRQRPLKFEKQKQKHTIVWKTKFYNPAKFELKQIQTLKVVH